MRVILVPVADRPECTHALQTAFDLGNRIGASISGCHIRPHRYSEVALSPGYPDAIWRRKSTKGAPQAAKTVFREIAEENGYVVARRPRATPCALWAERVGTPQRIMAIVGPVSDLVVVSRPKKTKTVADLFMRAALFETARPVLLLPPKNRRKVGQRVCIAWNQSAGTVNAVIAALPVLMHAREVTIATCGPEDRRGPKSKQLVNYLLHWGVKPERISTRGRKIERELVGICKEVRADLMISGAYSRSRWRERVFGGTTEFLIRKARMPVLMMHD